MLRFHRRTGFVFLDGTAARFVETGLGGRSNDLIWVENRSIVGARTIQVLRRRSPRLVNYNLDDPTGERDGNRWITFRRCVPLYDALVTVRRETEEELRALGARRTIRVLRSFAEVEHRPLDLGAAERAMWGK
jgi:hypothetical protein